MVRRDTGEKLFVPAGEVPARLKELQTLIQHSLFERAKAFRDENTVPVSSLDELISFFGAETAGTTGAKGGFAEALWCGSAECEASLKGKTKVTLRCLPLGKQEHVEGKCAICGAPARHRAIFARNY